MTKTILLIDDDLDLLPSMITLLEEMSNYKVFGANNGAQGLEMAVEKRPDCIVVDVKMPELDGYQFVRAMRGDNTTASIPLVILSALAQDKNKFVGLLSGADYYLIKPVSPRDLLQTVDSAMQVTEDDRIRRMREFSEQ